MYQSRQYLKQVAFKPPDVPSRKCCGWEQPWYGDLVYIASSVVLACFPSFQKSDPYGGGGQIRDRPLEASDHCSKGAGAGCCQF